MSQFPQKQFEGTTYTFHHLDSKTHVVTVGNPSVSITLHVTFGCHCFTEEFKSELHREHHRYMYKGEHRAFNALRYECSLQLPYVVFSELLDGMIYHAEKSLTYVALISLGGPDNKHDYSIFFDLEKDRSVQYPAVRMFVKSAYLKPLVAKVNAQNWRFKGLLAEISGAFPPKPKGKKPAKKKKKIAAGVV